MTDNGGFVRLARAWILRNPGIWQRMCYEAKRACDAGRTFSVRDWLCAEKWRHGCGHVAGCDYAYPHDATHDIARYLVDAYPCVASVVALRERDDDAPLVPLRDDAA